MNLEATAKALRNRFPRADLIVCADKGNGEDAAKKAAIEANALFAVPEFDQQLVERFKRMTGGLPTDFNDFYIATGEL